MHSKLFRLLFFVVMVLSTLNVGAQQNKTDEMGRKQGKWVKYKDGVKFYEGEFKDDKPTGEFLRYYKFLFVCFFFFFFIRIRRRRTILGSILFAQSFLFFPFFCLIRLVLLKRPHPSCSIFLFSGI